MRMMLAATALLTLPLATLGAGEVETLRQRCAEQERQIRELESENSRLRSLLERDGVPVGRVADPVPAAGKAPAAGRPVPATGGTAGSYVVKSGDTLARIARNHGTTAEELAELNGIRNPSLIQVGQQLRLPGGAPASAPAPAPTPAKPEPAGQAARSGPVAPDPASDGAPQVISTTTPQPLAGSGPAIRKTGERHVVKAGDTFYGIARIHGTTVDVLQKANPGLDPARLRVGQEILLAVAEPAAPQPAPSRTEAAPPAPAEEEPVVRLVRITEPITFGEFAGKHSTSTDKLNDLNGQALAASTLLAKDSELYVPVNR